MNKNYYVSRTIHLKGSFDDVFPLFSPEGEKNWAHGWHPKFIYYDQETARSGTVFSTGDGEAKTIWRLDEYNPKAGHVRLIRHALDRHLGVVDIRVKETGKNQTDATVTYDFTSISDEGARKMEEFGEESMGRMLDEWEVKINLYLKKGETLAPTADEHHQEWMDKF